ncbi:sialate:O-sulfotransferase 1-like [Diadema antillarum]|uniref:sialate:O-sulfotransferase 1-like n=1 Tax=Diadema antillarum TaxID=105358 RepID=UPI003A8B4217
MCVRMMLPIGLVVLFAVEVIFGVVVMTKLPLGRVVGPRVARWFGAEGSASKRVNEFEICSRIDFRPVQSLKTIALVSYPQSGNAWVRHLVERATGIYTGTVYPEEKGNPRTAKTFPGITADYKSGRVICSKTHRFDIEHILEFEGSILLIRHPARAMVSLAYKYNELTLEMSAKERRTLTQSPRWRFFVERESLRWRNLYFQWLQTAKSPLVVYYEDLVSSPNQTLQKMIRYMNSPVRQDLVDCALSRFPPLKTAKQRGRAHWWIPREYLHENPYTQELDSLIMEYMVDVNISLTDMGYKPFPWNSTVDVF